MTLRARLVLAMSTILVAVVAGGVLLVRTQEASLIATLDEQLTSASNLIGGPLSTRRPPPAPLDGAPTTPPDASPISDLFVGVVEGGAAVPVLAGQLLEDVPLVDPATAAAHVGEGPFTTDGVEGVTRFRIAVVDGTVDGQLTVVALPLGEVDHSVASLRRTLAITAGLIAAVLLLALWWVQRLGLRPIATITTAADAISSGERDRRVDVDVPGTEAGRLARAFNLMLDERDLSERRLRQFVADASHELRTPLTSIRGYLDLYGQGGFRGEGELADMLRRMGQEASRMHDLVEDLLLLAKLDEHRPLRSERVDLRQLVTDVATDAGVVQPGRPQRLHVDEHEDLTVTGDLFRLQQVLGVLVTNVLVHTPPTAELRLEARGREDAVTLVVADTGPGMAPDVADRVFDRFYRGAGSRSRRAGGSGLGLSIARSLVEAHGGTIQLRTAPGAGCRFTVVLPRAASQPHRPGSEAVGPVAPLDA